jgi:hypothetical protein
MYKMSMYYFSLYTVWHGIAYIIPGKLPLRKYNIGAYAVALELERGGGVRIEVRDRQCQPPDIRNSNRWDRQL